jgi:hypothetical protein
MLRPTPAPRLESTRQDSVVGSCRAYLTASYVAHLSRPRGQGRNSARWGRLERNGNRAGRCRDSSHRIVGGRPASGYLHRGAGAAMPQPRRVLRLIDCSPLHATSGDYAWLQRRCRPHACTPVGQCRDVFLLRNLNAGCALAFGANHPSQYFGQFDSGAPVEDLRSL